MVIDSSALIAILLREPEADPFVELALDTPFCVISATTYPEKCMVMIGRHGPEARANVDRLIQVLRAEIVPFTESQARRAVDAFLRYGKGQRQGANLNFGDCCSYALAADLQFPLLFKGSDFAKTDVGMVQGARLNP
jgi:ribonuclease VapC